MLESLLESFCLVGGWVGGLFLCLSPNAMRQLAKSDRTDGVIARARYTLHQAQADELGYYYIGGKVMTPKKQKQKFLQRKQINFTPNNKILKHPPLPPHTPHDTRPVRTFNLISRVWIGCVPMVPTVARCRGRCRCREMQGRCRGRCREVHLGER